MDEKKIKEILTDGKIAWERNQTNIKETSTENPTEKNVLDEFQTTLISENQLFLKYKERSEKFLKKRDDKMSVISTLSFKETHEAEFKDFNSLTDSIHEKVEFFRDREKKEEMYFTAYDLSILQILKHAVDYRQKEYRDLLEKRKQLESLYQLGGQTTDREKEQKKLIDAIGSISKEDIASINQEILSEIQILDDLLEKHKAQYTDLETDKTAIHKWLGVETGTENKQKKHCNSLNLSCIQTNPMILLLNS